MLAELIGEAEGLDGWYAEWDRLAVALGMPLCAPAWMLAWWRHARRGSATLRVVAVHEGDELIGIAPYFVQHGPLGLAEYRILGAGDAHRVAPLARPGREREVAALVAGKLAQASPRPASFLLEGVDASSAWPRYVRDAWQGRLRPRMRVGLVQVAPTMTLAEHTDFERWFASRSSNFRQQMRRKGRQLEARGGFIRTSRSEAELMSDLDAMVRLHHMRWASRGGSAALDAKVEAALRDAAPRLHGESRFRLWTIEVEGDPVCVQLFVAAGGELAYWGGGFDPAWQDVQPAQLAILAAVRDAFERGERRIDFGGGDQRYKWRFADRDEPIAWVSLFPRNARYPLTRLQLLPKESRQRVVRLAHRLPERWQDAIKRALRRGGDAT